MGREVVRAVSQAADLTLVGACDRIAAGEDPGVIAGIGPLGIKIETSLEEMLRHTGAEVLVDFTEPGVLWIAFILPLELACTGLLEPRGSARRIWRI